MTDAITALLALASAANGMAATLRLRPDAPEGLRGEAARLAEQFARVMAGLHEKLPPQGDDAAHRLAATKPACRPCGSNGSRVAMD